MYEYTHDYFHSGYTHDTFLHCTGTVYACINFPSQYALGNFKHGDFFGFFICMNFIQHCFIFRPSDSAVSENARIDFGTDCQTLKPLGYIPSTFTSRHGNFPPLSTQDKFSFVYITLQLLFVTRLSSFIVPTKNKLILGTRPHAIFTSLKTTRFKTCYL